MKKNHEESKAKHIFNISLATTERCKMCGVNISQVRPVFHSAENSGAKMHRGQRSLQKNNCSASECSAQTRFCRDTVPPTLTRDFQAR